jgi:cytochrome P450
MSTAPRVDIDLKAFWDDPYPTLAKLRREAPIAFVPQLGSTLFTKRDDIFVYEKQIDVFSSHQPEGLMNRLMGHNMMRKDGDAHIAERRVIFPSISPRTVKEHWTAQFQSHADRLLDGVEPSETVDFCRDFALPFSAECLKSITGLTNMRFQDMNAWSQAMIDGVANYIGDGAVEARCHEATAGIDAAIDERIPQLRGKEDLSLLGVMLASGMPMQSVRANIKLAISGGQNEPRDAVAGCVWALLTHREQLELALSGKVPWLNVFEEYARWISPIGMSPRRIANRLRSAILCSNRKIESSSCSARPIAMKRISIARRNSTSGATPQRASRSAPGRISAPAPLPRARWSPTSHCRRFFRACPPCACATTSRCGSAAGRSAGC